MAETPWTWAEGPVDPLLEHIELRYGDASRTAYDEWTPVALIGLPNGHVFPVGWLLATECDPEIASAARRDLNFYLVEHPKDFAGTGHPWGYAVYHCGTAANVYSKVHWTHFEGKKASGISRRDSLQSSGGKTVTGDQLFVTLKPGEYLRLAHEEGKVHRAFLDQKTGDMRICRPSMLQRSREWVKVGEDEYLSSPCDTC